MATERPKTYPIQFRADMQKAIRENCKTQTRRLNQKWLKAKKGDRLRILQSGGLLVEVTQDARLERLQGIQDVDVYDEGLQDCFTYCIDGQPWIGNGKADWPRQKAFRELWDSINADKPNSAWRDNPEVVVLCFRPIPHEENNA